MTAGYEVRPIRAAEWREARALRLAALTDDVARIAFLESHEEALARSEESWQERVARVSVDAGAAAVARQFVAVAADGTWVGSALALVERVGDPGTDGGTVQQDGGHLVGVYLAPEHRGRGVMERVFEAACAWLQERGLPQVRLHVHQDNARASRFYARCGFAFTGGGFVGPNGPEREMARPLAPRVTAEGSRSWGRRR